VTLAADGVPLGFVAASVVAGIAGEAAGQDVALVVNTGPEFSAAGVFTGEDSAPVLWSRQVLTTGRLRAVVLNAAGANVGLGPAGFQLTHAVAERAAELLDCGAIEVAVCSTGPAEVPLPRSKLLAGLTDAHARLTGLSVDDGEDSVTLARSRVAARRGASGWRAWGSVTTAQPPDTATLIVFCTDAVAGADELAEEVAALAGDGFADSSPGSSVLVLASGASGQVPGPGEIAEELIQLWTELELSGKVTP
jgi:glutamate N-acetyltransferase/amino-acid N-acetyltransferase